MTGRLFILLLGSFLAGALTVWIVPGGDPPRAGTGSTASPTSPVPGGAENPAREGSGSREESGSSGLGGDPGETGDAQRFGADAEAAERAARYRQLARVDPASLLEALPEFAERGESGLLLGEAGEVSALRLACESDPERALEIGESLGGSFGESVREAAFESLAAVDVDAALEQLASVAAGDLRNPRDPRNRFLAAIARGYARADLNGAVGWLATLTETDGAAIYPVIDAVAIVDLSRAIELDIWALGLDYPSTDYGNVAWLKNGLSANRQNVARIADQLALLQSKGLLADALGWWTLDDPYGAIGWIQTQETISSVAVSRMASRLAHQDYVNAMRLAGQFSRPIQAEWIATVAGTAAEYDVYGAIDLLEPFREEPFYGEARARTLVSAARSLDPPEAAALAGSAPSFSAAGEIARRWVLTDPLAAAGWALAIGDESLRRSTLRQVIQRWVDSDPESAERWVTGMADAALRSQMMTYVCPPARACAPRL